MAEVGQMTAGSGAGGGVLELAGTRILAGDLSPPVCGGGCRCFLPRYHLQAGRALSIGLNQEPKLLTPTFALFNPRRSGLVWVVMLTARSPIISIAQTPSTSGTV